MKVFIVSLGTIVKTDFNVAVAGFMKAAGLEGQDPRPYLPRLLPLCNRYNLGELTSIEFENEFVKVLPIKDLSQFKSIWNSMCVVDAAAKETLALLSTHHGHDNVQIMIYSDTNPMHYDAITTQLGNVLPFETSLSFEKKKSKADMLADIMMRYKQEQLVVVLGNTDKISEQQLQDMVKVRDGAVAEAAQTLQMRLVFLSRPRLTVEDCRTYLGLVEKPAPASLLVDRLEGAISGLSITNAGNITTTGSGSILLSSMPSDLTLGSTSISGGTLVFTGASGGALNRYEPPAPATSSSTGSRSALLQSMAIGDEDDLDDEVDLASAPKDATGPHVSDVKKSSFQNK